jgi:hypothetical protein
MKLDKKNKKLELKRIDVFIEEFCFQKILKGKANCLVDLII